MRDRNYTTEEIIRRGHEIYDRLEASHEGQFVVVDVTTGTWEIDEDDVAASDRALARNPGAVLYFARVGHLRHTAWASARVFVGGTLTVKGTVTSDDREANMSIEVPSASGSPATA